MRGTLSILALVAAVAAGLYFLARSNEPEPDTAPVETAAPSTEPEPGATPPAATDAASPPASVARTATSDARTTTPEPAALIEEEAKEYVETLIAPTPQPVPVDRADHFVPPEQELSLVPEDIIEHVSVRTLAGDETLASDTPVTIVREVEQIEIATPEQLIAEAGGDLDATVQVLVEPERRTVEAPGSVPVAPQPPGTEAEGAAETPVQVVVRPEQPRAGTDGNLDTEESAPARPLRLIAKPGVDAGAPARIVADPGQPRAGTDGDAEAQGSIEASDDAKPYERVTVRELLDRMLADPGKPISIVKKVRYFEVTTLGDLLESEGDPDAVLTVITQPYRIEAATLADLLQKQMSEHPDSIFYVRTVRPTDRQGIWGIIHSGLIDNFARGMAVRRGEQVETYTVDIPPEADEVRHDRSSSFLGRLIHRKTRDSFVYNFRENRMGRNPDRVYPGQEIVIVNFESEELIAIYKHFTGGRG